MSKVKWVLLSVVVSFAYAALMVTYHVWTSPALPFAGISALVLEGAAICVPLGLLFGFSTVSLILRFTTKR
jgi:hypothetical protein